MLSTLFCGPPWASQFHTIKARALRIADAETCLNPLYVGRDRQVDAHTPVCAAILVVGLKETWSGMNEHIPASSTMSWYHVRSFRSLVYVGVEQQLCQVALGCSPESTASVMCSQHYVLWASLDKQMGHCESTCCKTCKCRHVHESYVCGGR